MLSIFTPMKNYPFPIRVAADATGILLIGMMAFLPAMRSQAQAVPDSTTERDQAGPVVSKENSAPSAQDTVVMSPFEVISNERGYYSSTTMSGTRLNSKVEDLAASITVVTKQQMSDFALLDINDVFAYEAGTEGSLTYTDIAANADGVPIDSTQLSPNTANRVRGISSANLSFGNFQTSGRVPVDPIIIEAVEINRGPNSSVFGLGNAGGTVNLQPVSANLTQDKSEAKIRGDSYDGWRTSLDLNRVLSKNRLAVRVSGVYQRDGFERKPSGTDTRRLNGMVKFRPFENTTISGFYSNYHLTGNRPNTTMPLDGISLWESAGRPTWDPVTATVHIDGKSAGTFTPTTLPAYFSTSSSLRTYSTVAVDGSGQVSQWMPMQMTTSTTDPNASKQNVFIVITSPNQLRQTQPLWSSNAQLGDKSIYDWSSINLAAVNQLRQDTNTAMLNIQQIILNTPMQLLAAEGGFYREDSQSYARNIIGGAGSSGRIGYLNMDVNERLPTGQPNPFFLRPYLGISLPQDIDEPLRHETARAQLAYRLDFRREKNLLRWLGLHQLSVYGEYQDRIRRSIGYRDIIADDHSWLLPVPRATVNAAQGGGTDVARNYFRYYVGDKGPHVDYAPGRLSYGTYPYVWGNGVTGVFKTESALLAQGISADRTAGSSNSRQVIKTRGATLQSFFWNDRIVTTVGVRQDTNHNKVGITPKFLADGTLDWDSWNAWGPADWIIKKGTTKTVGVVAKVLPWLNLHANFSDSFEPSATAYDIFLNPLPDPTGRGHDYGVTLKLLDGRLVMRVIKYETKQIDARAGATAAARTRAMDFDFVSSSTNRSNWLNANALRWITAAAAANGQTLTPDQATAQVAALMGFSVEEYNAQKDVPNSSISETADVLAKGREVEINYNPTNYFTVKLNAVKLESINLHLSPAVTEWIEKRMPIWEKIIDPETKTPWYTTSYPGASASARTPSAFLSGTVLTPLGVDKALEGKSRPQVRKYKVNLATSYRMAGLTDHKVLKRVTVGGALRWEDRGSIGFYGVESPPTIVTDLDPTRPIWDKAHLYADAFVSYRTRLFADKVSTTFQLNVRNLQESGRLQAVAAYPDGTPWAFRIVDPRQFILSASFEF